MITFLIGIFILAASCYILFITSDPLEKVGERIGKLLKLPEPVIASTFAAAATSGGEIVMAILAAMPFVASSVWATLELGERACSGTLNMAFSAMDNLLGVGAVAIILLLFRKKIDPDGKIPRSPTTIIGLGFYVVSSGCLATFMIDQIITVTEAWILAIIGIAFVLSQFIIPPILAAVLPDDDDDDDDDDSEDPIPSLVDKPLGWSWDMFKSLFAYSALLFVLVIMVREAMGATFDMATVGIFSVGGILIMFTSYITSFPEFMLSYRYAIADKKDALLAMLFGSNVIDLAFAGFRPIWLKQDMHVYTTGYMPGLLHAYIWALPVLALIILFGLMAQKITWKMSVPAFIFYIVYIVSGWILL